MNRHEFVSRTQKSIRKISTPALKARARGASSVYEGLEFVVAMNNREEARELIASLNYSVRQAEREVAFREKVAKKRAGA